MAAPTDASLPPFLTLADGYQIVFDAVDATTGVTVAGVVISGRSFGVDPVAGPSGGKEGPFAPQYSLGDLSV